MCVWHDAPGPAGPEGGPMTAPPCVYQWHMDPGDERRRRWCSVCKDREAGGIVCGRLFFCVRCAREIHREMQFLIENRSVRP
jgi:hypothetical protein